MSTTTESSIPVNLTNPGEYLACCGLLEAAWRLDSAARGWFTKEQFHLRTSSHTIDDVIAEIRRGTFVPANASTADAEPETGEDEDDRESGGSEGNQPLVFTGTFTLRLDWYADTLAGGSRFKTWAGQQTVLAITRAMHAGLAAVLDGGGTLWTQARDVGLPFNFDADLGLQGSAIDVGFSFDPLEANQRSRISRGCRPGLELLALLGLQRFRPGDDREHGEFTYAAWSLPLPPPVAVAAAAHLIDTPAARRFRFRLKYRTKYLKSFLTAEPESRA